MGFGSLGISELLVIFVIVLVFFGPRRMPEVARSLGSAMREFRRSLNQIQRELEEADPTRDLRRETKDIFSRMPEEVRPGKSGTSGRTATPDGPAPAEPQGGSEAAESREQPTPVRSEPTDSQPAPEPPGRDSESG
jgi:Tat protein translocase TatB subunit